MTAIDRYTLIEAAANGVPLWGTDSDADGYTFSYERGAEEIIADTLPVIARELLAPLRELHRPHPYADAQLRSVSPSLPEFVCAHCATPSGGAVAFPCPTVRLLDQIEADVAGVTHA